MGDKPPAFQPPPWAAAPSCSAWLEAHGAGDAPDSAPLETIRVDAAPFVTFGRDAEAADVHLDDRHAPHGSMKREGLGPHAALSCAQRCFPLRSCGPARGASTRV
jgi:hypothetical protein